MANHNTHTCTIIVNQHCLTVHLTPELFDSFFLFLFLFLSLLCLPLISVCPTSNFSSLSDYLYSPLLSFPLIPPISSPVFSILLSPPVNIGMDTADIHRRRISLFSLTANHTHAHTTHTNAH